jgi:adenosylmethionine-8-amino-7-oxononanoate aminotransferase
MYEFVRGDGIYLFDKQNNAFVDLISGIAVNNLGHNNKKVIRAIKKQVDKYSHQMVYGEYIIGPQIKLAKRLSKLLPETLDTFYFLNSGSEAVEGALKLAKKYNIPVAWNLAGGYQVDADGNINKVLNLIKIPSGVSFISPVI